MSEIIFGAAATLGLFLMIYLIFRYRVDQGDTSHTGTHFSAYDGGHDDLGEHGGDSGGGGGGG